MESVQLAGVRAEGLALSLCVLRGDRRRRGSRGAVFQTGLPFGRESGGLKTPRLLRDRPTDGAARACNFMRALRASGRRLWLGYGRFRGDWLCKAKGCGACEGYACQRPIG